MTVLKRDITAIMTVLPLVLSSLVISPAAQAQAVPKVGTCPSGYHTSGDYCLGSSDDAKHAIPKTGACPSGYHTSGGYCLSHR